MKFTKFITAAALAALTFTACEKIETDPVEPVIGIKGALVLNNGNWGSNDASMTLYNPETKAVTGGVFFNANGRHLGDLGQDMLAYGEDIYISVNNSQVIFITDRDLKVRMPLEVTKDGVRLSPRSFAVGGGKIYVTYYEGYLGEIDPASYNVRLTEVGPNPDGLAYAGGNIYVANSGGYLAPTYNNTVSVVSAASFRETATIEVNCNPAEIVASRDGRYVYVTSYGDYSAIQPKLQVIDTRTSAVSDSDYSNVKKIAMGRNDELLVVTGDYDENWNIAGTIWKHDAGSNSRKGKFTESVISPFYSISADTATGYVFVGASDYISNGDVLFFDASGKQIDKFDSQGLNPQKVLFFQ